MRIAVLYDDVRSRLGSTADERGVLEAVDSVQQALAELTHTSVTIAAGARTMEWAARLAQDSVQLVFNLCEAVGGTSVLEAPAAGVLELLGLPFTGSSAETLALARRKDRVNALLERAGLPVPAWRLVGPGEAVPPWRRYPAIVKPAGEDASLGISQESVVRDAAELAAALERAWQYGAAVVQEFLSGREFNVGLVDDEVLPVAEILFEGMPPGHWPLLCYRAKWDTGSAEDRGSVPQCPAQLDRRTREEAIRLARAAWRMIEGQGYGRVDLRTDSAGRLHVLEVNPNPDLSPTAGLTRMAGARGWSYAELISRVVQAAQRDHPEAGVQRRREALTALRALPSAASPARRSAEGTPGAGVAVSRDGKGAGWSGGGNGRARAGAGGAVDDVAPPIQIEPLRPGDRTAVTEILSQSGFFRDQEIDIALEVLDSFFNHPGQDYTALGAFTPGGDLLGYVCYGPTPGTAGTWDLYWIAVAPAVQHAGVGTLLLQEVERRLAREDARLVLIETSSQPLYQPTRAFYARRGYREVARVPDFYAEGDDRVIYARRLQPSISGKRNHGNVATDPAAEPYHRRRAR